MIYTLTVSPQQYGATMSNAVELFKFNKRFSVTTGKVIMRLSAPWSFVCSVSESLSELFTKWGKRMSGSVLYLIILDDSQMSQFFYLAGHVLGVHRSSNSQSLIL